jgi:hypothetical protein
MARQSVVSKVDVPKLGYKRGHRSPKGRPNKRLHPTTYRSVFQRLCAGKNASS